MLPAFVIGLREGLETVVVIGAIAIFLRLRDRGDLLPRVWRASALAAAVCIVVGFMIRYVEIKLPWRQQEQFETIIGLVAVATVSYMIIWMRRFPKDLRRQSDAAASAALDKNWGRGLVLLAFFAVLREGFEITVFVVATIGLTGRSAWLSTGGAFLGVAAALAIGIGVVRGTSHLDVARFFRATALILVLSAAGIAMTAVRTANAAGWITFGQRPQFDLSWLAPPGSVLSSFTTGMFGFQSNPAMIEVVVWLAYLVPMTVIVLWPTRSAILHRMGWIAAGALAVAITVGLVLALPSSAPLSGRTTASAKVLFAGLDSVACMSATHCVAVGDFLPQDKDAAVGDPDGDGHSTRTLIESSDDRRWAHDPSPDQGRGGDQLSSVSCPSKASCVAVGFYRPDPFPPSASSAPPVYPLIESETKGRWRVVESPAVGADSVFAGVSCPTVSDCTAVGYRNIGQYAGNPVESLFVEHFDGQSWALDSLSPPADDSSGLNSISCPSASTCIAVGDVAPASDPADTRPMVEELVNGEWTTAALPSQGTQAGILYDVECPTMGRCLAVGNAVTSQTTGAPLVLSLAGSTWSVDQAALGQADDVSLTALGCADGTDCVAAGTSLESAEKVVARLDGAGWAPLTPLGFSENVEAITCTTPTSCVAVGSTYVNEIGNTDTLIASLSRGGWTVERAPAL